MYKNYQIDANLITSVTTLVKHHPSLSLPFLEAIEEWVSNKYRREIENERLVNKEKYHELCLKFANAIDESANALGDDFIYVPMSMHYQIRLSGVRNGNQVMNFLKPLIGID